MTPSKRNKFFIAYLVATCLTFVLLIVFASVQAYVRWTLNQNFSFLGDTGLLSLAIVLFAQFGGLAYLLKD